MSVEIYTIEHTGTRFVLDILNRAGLGKRGICRQPPDPDRVYEHFPKRKNKNCLPPVRSHCRMCIPSDGPDPRCPQGWEEPGDSTPLVVTVRNPLDCLQSWYRKKNRDNLLPNFIATWAHFLWRLQNRRVFYFALDADEREMQIRELLDYCGLPQQDWVTEYAENWTPIGKSSGESLNVTRHIEAQLQFATEWYEYRTEYWGE